MEPSMGYFTIFELLIGAYLLWCAVAGKGKVFENENLKIPRERYLKVMRILAAATGGVLLLSNGLVALGAVAEGSGVSWALWTVGLGCILAMAVYSSKASERRAARQEAPGQAKDPLRAAFVFDEEDEDGDGEVK